MITVGDKPDGSDGVDLVVEQIGPDGIIVTHESAAAAGLVGDVEAGGPLDAPLDDEPEAFQLNPLSIDAVLAVLPEVNADGAVLTRPEVHLTGDQAVLLLKLYKALDRQGKTFRTQGDVVGWLLDEISRHL